MSEEYEIIFITEEGRAIKNNKTGKIYHSEFEIIEEKNQEIERLNNKIKEQNLLLIEFQDMEQKVEQLEKENHRLNNIINELEKYIHNELILDFYNDDMPCELIINKMEKMIKALKENK